MAIYTKKGDALQGYKITVQCREHSDWKLFHMTSSHRGSRCTLTDNVFCVIDVPLKACMK